MSKEFKSPIQKSICLKLLNLLLSPYVVGHLDSRDYSQYIIMKNNCTAFRSVGGTNWQIHDPKEEGMYLTPISLKQRTAFELFDFKTFKEIFQKEQFEHPVRTAIVESLVQL